MEVIVASFNYVQSDPFFWGSMGFIVAIAMLVGTMIYGSDRNSVHKFFVGMAPYILLLLFVNFTRASKSITPDFTLRQSSMALASTVTIIAVTLFWFLGLSIGLLIDKWKRFLRSRE